MVRRKWHVGLLLVSIFEVLGTLFGCSSWPGCSGDIARRHCMKLLRPYATQHTAHSTQPASQPVQPSQLIAWSALVSPRLNSTTIHRKSQRSDNKLVKPKLLFGSVHDIRLEYLTFIVPTTVVSHRFSSIFFFVVND